MKKISILLVCAAVLALLLGCTGCGEQKAAERLSDSEIDALRTEYPLISESQMQLDYPMFDLETRLEIIPILAEIEVLQALPGYTVTGTHTISETETYTEELLFHQFEVKPHDVWINRTGAELPETLVICFADIFASSYPELDVHDHAVVSLSESRGSHTGKYHFSDETAYYMTDTGYLLSVYEERGTRLSGLSKNAFESKITGLLAVK